MLRIAGVDVSASAAAKLAYLLHEHGEVGLAGHLGHAVDHLHDQVVLTRRDKETILEVLTICPPELAGLRASLFEEHRRKAAARAGSLGRGLIASEQTAM